MSGIPNPPKKTQPLFSPRAKTRCDGCGKWKLLTKLRSHEGTGELRCKPCYAEMV